MSIHKIFNFESKILPDETFKKFGYYPDQYGESSSKFVIASCRYCGKNSEIRKCFFKKSGSACHKDCRLKEQASFSPFKDSETQSKVRETIKRKYGVEYVSQNKDVASKISISRNKGKLTQSYIDLSKKLFNNNIKFVQNHNLLVISGRLAISCHWSKDLINPVNKNFVWEQSKRILKEYGLHTFHIFEHQWPSRSKQIWNFIKTQLGLNEVKIPARKCVFNSNDVPNFFEDYHIQGRPQLVLRYFNLVYDGEVVASMSASRHHRQNADVGTVVLSRLCFKDGSNVQGGASKLFRAFVDWARGKSYNRIISWSDNCWTAGKIYSVLGFRLEKEYFPDYFYWDVGCNKYVSKQSQQKKKTGCPDGMTEQEWCQERGLFRIWDCGKRKWIYDLGVRI